MKMVNAGGLQRHPFGVEAFFRRSLVLTYAVPATALAHFVSPGLELDTYGDWGFVAVAMVQTEDLRPRGLPHWFGRDFFLSGYRIFSRFNRPGQSTLRGLRILRSDTDRRMMASIGNVFTRYNYRLAKVNIKVDKERLEVVADLSSLPAALPEGTPFQSIEDARNFAGPLPFTFSYDEIRQKMVVVKGVRKAWDPQPVRVLVRKATFFDSPRFAGVELRLANAFYLENVPYSWNPGTLQAIG